MIDKKIKGIKANYRRPSAIKKEILYPQYIGLVKVEIPRLFFSPRVIRSYVIVDGGTGKTVRCNAWPSFEDYTTDGVNLIRERIQTEEAKIQIIEFARKRLARKYLSYWNPIIYIEKFEKTYKLFWLTDEKTVIDSISNRVLSFK